MLSSAALDAFSRANAWIVPMTIQVAKLDLSRCPHCSTAHPHLDRSASTESVDHKNQRRRTWVVYVCQSCGGAVLTGAKKTSGPGSGVISEQYPAGRSLVEDVPERARAYLVHAQETLHAPPAAILMAASAVDAMLKARGFNDGNLYGRIDAAAAAHVLTKDMAEWAHDIRLDANDQRHADEATALPTGDDAARVFEFALALAEYLFVLPARVKRGRRKDETG